MQHILTDIKDPIPVQEFDGEIKLFEARFWPAWKPQKFSTLFSYELGGKKYVVPVISGKTYTFETIQNIINDHLNFSEQVALLYHNNGRVTWRIFPQEEIKNPKLSAGMITFLRPKKIELSFALIDMLKLGDARAYDGITTGQPVSKDSIAFTFSNANMLFLECKQINGMYLNGKQSNILCVIPVAADLDDSITANLYHPIIATYRENFSKELTFRIHDKHGNDLPIKQALIRFTINGKHL